MPRFRKRYMHDICAIIRKEKEVENRLDLLNWLHPHIRFMLEMEKKGPFLDLLLSRKQKSSCQTSHLQHLKLCSSAQSHLFQPHYLPDANPSHFLKRRGETEYLRSQTEWIHRPDHQHFNLQTMLMDLTYKHSLNSGSLDIILYKRELNFSPNWLKDATAVQMFKFYEKIWYEKIVLNAHKTVVTDHVKHTILSFQCRNCTFSCAQSLQ